MPIGLGIVAACGLLPGLTARSLSYDEGVSAAMAAARWSSFTGTVSTSETNMSLYYLMLRCLQFLDPGPGALRAPSLVAFAVALPLVAFAGAHLVGRTAGVIGALLVATNAHVVTSALTARSYALLLTMTVVSTVLLLRAKDVRGRRQSALLLAWGLISGITAYVHLLGVVTTTAQVIGVSVAWPRMVRSLAMGVVTAVILSVPLVVAALHQGSAAISWIPQPTLGALGSASAEVMGGVLSLGVVNVVVVWACVSGAAARDPSIRFLLSLVLVPVVGLYVASLLGPTSLLLPRYLIAVTPSAANGLALRVDLVFRC